MSKTTWYLVSFLTNVANNNIDSVGNALNNGIDINSSDADHRTAVHSATRLGFSTMLEYLLLKKADPNIQDKFGKTPLHYATHLKNEGLVNILLREKANKNIRDTDGNKPYDIYQIDSLKTSITRPKRRDSKQKTFHDFIFDLQAETINSLEDLSKQSSIMARIPIIKDYAIRNMVNKKESYKIDGEEKQLSALGLYVMKTYGDSKEFPEQDPLLTSMIKYASSDTIKELNQTISSFHPNIKTRINEEITQAQSREISRCRKFISFLVHKFGISIGKKEENVLVI